LRFSFTFPRRSVTGRIHVFSDGRVEDRGRGVREVLHPPPGWVSAQQVQRAVELAARMLDARRKISYYDNDPSHILDLDVNIQGTLHSARFDWERVSNYDIHYDPVEGAEALEEFGTLVDFLEEFEKVARAAASR
jgi:hypothetical protein